jgi:transketolase
MEQSKTKRMNSVELARLIRVESLKAVHNAHASHIGSALSIVDILAVLYQDVMTYDEANELYINRDRLILSKGHACISLYVVLGLKGFFNLRDLESYATNDSIFMSHISSKVPGVEFSTGSLGHGLPFALGKALAMKLNNQSSKSYVILGDGEVAEGSNWEAIFFAAHNKIDNLHIIIDRNNLQSLDTVDNTMSIEPLADKLMAFGLDVVEIDGHNHSVLRQALSREVKNKPLATIARTIKGKGVSFMENQIAWHYKSPTQDELEIALKELGHEK